MEKIFRHAGLPEEVVSLIAEIIHTCRECRVWQLPGPSVTASVELPCKQNEFVEGDIMFYKMFFFFQTPF